MLLTAWRTAEGLRGLPDVLRMNRYVAQADPLLAADLAKIGVRLEIADAKDKTVPASLRSAQDASGWLLKKHDPVDLSLAASVEALCLDAQEDHNRSAHRGPRRLSNRKLEDKIERWLELPMQQPANIPFEGVEWEAGAWLSSWETSLPPDQPRYFHHDGMSRRTWLILGEGPSEEMDDDNPAYEEHDNTPEIAKNLVARSPQTRGPIAAVPWHAHPNLWQPAQCSRPALSQAGLLPA